MFIYCYDPITDEMILCFGIADCNEVARKLGYSEQDILKGRHIHSVNA